MPSGSKRRRERSVGPDGHRLDLLGSRRPRPLRSLGGARSLRYVASRCAPLAPAGPEAVIAAFGSISPPVIRHTFELVEANVVVLALWEARDAAVLEGLVSTVPSPTPQPRDAGNSNDFTSGFARPINSSPTSGSASR